MPLVSLLEEDFQKSFGVQPGRKRVVSADWMVHQFPPNKEGKQSEPFVCLGIGYLPIDDKGMAIGEMQLDTALKVGPKFGETLDKSKFAPASAPDKPLALRLGSKGPFLEAIGDSSKLSDNSKAALYLKHLFAAGFDKKRFGESKCNIGLLVGTEGDLIEITAENDGTDKETGEKFKPTKIMAFKAPIIRWGYETPAGAAAVAGHVNGVAAPAAAVSTGDASELALTVLKELGKTLSGSSLSTEDVGKKILGVTQKFATKPHPDTRKAAQELLKSVDFYSSVPEDIAIIEGDQVTFA